MKSSWFAKAPSLTVRLLFFLFASIALMVMDHRLHYLDGVRAVLSIAVYPVRIVSVLPQRLVSGVGEFFASRTRLRAENANLRREQLELRVRLQRLEAIEAENARLRRLLGAARRVAQRPLVAEMLEVSLEPFTQKILLNKGSRDGVYPGQPVLDAEGVVGQITQVAPFTSTATLITDSTHAIPVQVRRNGLRGILFGTGVPGRLRLPHLDVLADIRAGDVLVTSGMGGRFPPGYPVARVRRIHRDPNEAFLSVEAEPVARLDYGKEVLLIGFKARARGGGGGDG